MSWRRCAAIATRSVAITTRSKRPHVRGWLLARNDAAAAAKRARLTARGPSPAFFGTVSEAIDLIGQYQDAGIGLLMNGDRNDEEARELFASDVMPHLA